MSRYCITIPELNDDCWEVIPTYVNGKELCDLQNKTPKPSKFIYDGKTYNFSEHIIRELTETELKDLTHLPKQEQTVNRQKEEYQKWLFLNDESERLGITSFKVGETKYNTINREEFKLVVEEGKKQGKFNIEYREMIFSVYHYC